jgi:hypothetical protein
MKPCPSQMSSCGLSLPMFRWKVFEPETSNPIFVQPLSDTENLASFSIESLGRFSISYPCRALFSFSWHYEMWRNGSFCCVHTSYNGYHFTGPRFSMDYFDTSLNQCLSGFVRHCDLRLFHISNAHRFTVELLWGVIELKSNLCKRGYRPHSVQTAIKTSKCIRKERIVAGFHW